jgi:hypothetical protein
MRNIPEGSQGSRGRRRTGGAEAACTENAKHARHMRACESTCVADAATEACLRFLQRMQRQNKSHDVVVEDVGRHAGLSCKRGTRSW